MPSMCIRCGIVEAPQPLGYCPSCALEARQEVAGGIKRLLSYLGAWAAFEAWLDDRGAEQP